MSSDGPSPLHTHDKTTATPSPSPKKFYKPVPSPRMQIKTLTDLTCRRHMTPLNAPNGVESSARQRDLYDDSVDSDSDSGSDQAFKPEQVLHDSDGTDRSGCRSRKSKPDVTTDIRTRRSTRVTPSHKMIDWSSDSDDGATPDVLWKGNRRERISPPTPGPSDGGGKRPRGRPRKYGSSRS